MHAYFSERRIIIMNKIKDLSFVKKFIIAAISLAVLSVCMVLICTVSNQAVAEEETATESNVLQLGKITINPEKAVVNGYYNDFYGNYIEFPENTKQFDFSTIIEGRTLRIDPTNGCSYQISKYESGMTLNVNLCDVNNNYASVSMSIKMHNGWEYYCLHDNVKELNDDFVYFIDDEKANNFDFYEAADSPATADIVVNSNSTQIHNLYTFNKDHQTEIYSFEDSVTIHLEKAHYPTYFYSSSKHFSINFYDDNDMLCQYFFNCKAKVGYDLLGLNPEPEMDKYVPITDNISFEYKAQPTTYKYNVKLAISNDISQQVTDKPSLKFYNLKGEFVDSLIYDSEHGFYVLPNDISADNAVGTIIGSVENYSTDVFVSVSPSSYNLENNTYICFCNAAVGNNEFFTLSNAIDGNVVNWDMNCQAIAGNCVLYDNPVILPSEWNSVKFSMMGFSMFINGSIMSPSPSINSESDITFSVKDNGKMTVSMGLAPHINETIATSQIDFIPNFADGKELDYWKVNEDNLTPGQTLAIDMASAEQINTQLFSRDVVPGGGGGESEDINASAQTGDMGIYVIVALAIMAISAGVVFAARRRIN